MTKQIGNAVLAYTYLFFIFPSAAMYTIINSMNTEI